MFRNGVISILTNSLLASVCVHVFLFTYSNIRIFERDFSIVSFSNFSYFPLAFVNHSPISHVEFLENIIVVIMCFISKLPSCPNNFFSLLLDECMGRISNTVIMDSFQNITLSHEV